MRNVLAQLRPSIGRWHQSRRRSERGASSERGDTLVEVLLALMVLGIAGFALLTAFATSITTASIHRNLASLDASDRTAVNAAIADIQQEAGSATNNPFACPDTFVPTFPSLTGSYQVTYTMLWWTGSGWSSTCTAGVPQQYTLTVSSNSTPSQPSPPVTTVITDPAPPAAPNGAGAAYKLVWLQTPTGGTAFSPITPQPEVAVEDVQGDIVTSDFSAATLSLVSGPGTISSTCAGVESYGIVQFTDCSMSAAGSYTINAVDGNLIPAGNTSFSVQAATASKIGFTTAVVSGTASNSATLGPVTVQRQDPFGNPVTSTTAVTVNLSSSPGGTFSATLSGPAITSVTIPAGAATASANFYFGDTIAGSPTITASSSGLLSGTQTETIAAGAGTQLAITSAPFSAPSGSSATSPFTVTLEDTNGNATTKTSAITVNLTTTATSTGKFAATSGGATVTKVTLPANASSVTAYYGDTTLGTPTITAAATGLTSGSQKETVTTGPTKLVLSGPTSGGASSGAAIGPFTVTEETAAGVPTTASETVNLSSASTGTYIFNGTQGVTSPTGATSVNIPGGQSSVTFYYGDTAVSTSTTTITAAATGLTPATQKETITAGPAAQLIFTTTSKSGGASMSPTLGPITVQEKDAFGNVSTTALTVNLSSTSQGTNEFAATTGGTAVTSVAIPGGSSTASFFYGDTASGTPTITAAATGLTSGTQQETITAGTGTHLAISSTPFAGAANSQATSAFTVTLQDALGNATTKTTATTVNLSSNSTGIHSFSATSGGTAITSISLPANTASVTAYYGDEKPGTPTITAAATGLNPAATQQELIVAGAPSKLIFTTGPVSGSASTNATLGPITVQEQDAYGNVAASGSPTAVTLTSTSPGASFAATSGGAAVTQVTIPGSTSTATFFYGDTKAGTPTITAAVTGLASATQQETITALAGTQLSVSTFSAKAGTSATNLFTVGVVDVFGNATTRANATTVGLSSNSTGTFKFAASSGGGSVTSVTLPANATSVNAYYADTAAGTPTITATATGLASGLRQETITGGTPTTIAVSSGAGQTGTVSTPFTNPLVAFVTDAFGNPVSGATVTFTAPAATGASGTVLASTNGGTCLATGGNAVASCTATTNASGLANSLTFTGDTHAGTYNVAATSAGTTPNPVNYSETNIAATTNDNMTITSGNNQSVSVGAGYPTTMTVNIVDSFNNPVPNMVVTFTAPASGASGTFGTCSGGNNASFTTCLVATNGAGNASASTFTANHSAGAVSVVTSASGDTTPPAFSETNKAGTATTIAVSSGAGQSTTVSTAFTSPTVAFVTDSFGNPVSGATVTFTAPAATGASGTVLASTNGGTCLATGGNAVASCTATTNASGLASSLTLKADTHAGTYNVAATSAGTTPNPVTYSETNTAATTNDNTTITTGNNQSATVGGAFPTALGVNIVDSFNNPVPNMVVTFTAPASGASGTFGTCPGGNNASFTTCLVATNASGNASASTFTTNHTAGGFSVATSDPGDTTPPTFSETSTAGTAATIAAYSGGAQSTTVSTAFTNPLLAQVTDAFGNPVSGATVTFTAPAATGASGTVLASTNGGTCLATGGTAVASCTATTSATGLASSLTLKADTHAGTYNVAATSAGTTPNPVTYSETNTAATTNDNMTITTGNGQSAMVGAGYSTTLGVNIVDSFGNPVPNMVVTFTAPASGASGTFGTCSGGNNGSFTTCLVATNAAGNASASTFTANHSAGAVSVATSASGDTTPPAFSETNTAGLATTIAVSSGAGQTGTVNASFTNPLVALVTDSFGNPVSGATVTFTAPAATGASGTVLASTNGGTCLSTGGNAVASCTATTSATGLASSLTLKADTHAGTYNVAATSPGTTPNPVNFSETNTAGTATTIAVSSGAGQSTTVSTAFTSPTVAFVTDSFGNPVSGATVTFTAPAATGASGTVLASTNGGTCLATGGNAVASCTATTNASGLASSLTLKADTHAGTYNVAATSAGTTPNPVTYSETNTAATTNDNTTITTGNNQSATVGGAFPTALGVNIVDSFNNPVPNMVVTFTAPASGASGTFGTCPGGNNASFTTCLVATNASGNASASTFTTNHTAGGFSVATSDPGDTTPPTFSETSTAGTAATIAAYSGGAQSTTVSTAFTNPLLAQVTDAFGNPVSGATVTFTAPAATGASGTVLASTNGGTCLATGGTAVASCTATTSATGLASSLTLKADTHAGTYNVAATSAGTTPNPVTYSETNTVPLTVTSVANGTGTTSATSSTFAMASGTTYVVSAFEQAGATVAAPTLTINGNPATTLVATNNFGGTTSPDCTSTRCYVFAWSFNANTTSGTATVKVTGTGSSQNFVLDVMALGGNNTTTPIVQSNATQAGQRGTISANLTSAPAAGDASIEIVGADNTIGTALTWSAGSANLFNSSGTNASLGTYWTSTAAQTDTASSSGFGGSKDWATIALEINNA